MTKRCVPYRLPKYLFKCRKYSSTIGKLWKPVPTFAIICVKHCTRNKKFSVSEIHFQKVSFIY